MKVTRVQRVVLAIILVYIILLIGPTAGFDVPEIAGAISNQPVQFFQFLIIGLANGSILAIIALGYTMVYGIIELINFAHGDVFMIGVFVSLTTLSLLGAVDSTNTVEIILALIVALVVAVVFCAVLNATIERVAYRRLRNSPRLAPLISAIGVSYILANCGLIWAAQSWLVPSFGSSGGAATKKFPDLLTKIAELSGQSVDILASTGIGLRLTYKEILVIILAAALMVGLRFFVQNTQLGKAMRATAQSREAARMMGIDIDRVITTTFLIGGGLAGAAGIMAGLYNTSATWNMGFRAGLYAFTAAVLGGIGNITGAMLGGILIGLLASFSDGYFSTEWTQAWIFSTLVIILLFRPSGLLGEHVAQKA